MVDAICSSAMPLKRRLTAEKVTAYLPYSVDLTKLKSGNTLDVQVRSGLELLGTLLLGRGSRAVVAAWEQDSCAAEELEAVCGDPNEAHGERVCAIARATLQVYTTAGNVWRWL